MKEVVVITGHGAIGLACARRLGLNKEIILCDADDTALEEAARGLLEMGYAVTTRKIDVSDKESIGLIAHEACSLGNITAVIHTIAVSPFAASIEEIIDVNLVGTANVMEVFLDYVVPGQVALMIAGMAGRFTSVSEDVQHQLATISSSDLKRYVQSIPISSPTHAFMLSKLGIQLRVEAAACEWGQCGGRILSVSPGIISTKFSDNTCLHERMAIEKSLNQIPVSRIGTPEDVASVCEFLTSDKASFITGSDILVDGGSVAQMKYAR